MNFTKTQTKDILWHSAKALLCAAQLYILDMVTAYSLNDLMRFLIMELIITEGSVAQALLSLIRPAVVLLLVFVLWRYYDNIDDYSFNRFCATYKDTTQAPNLLKDPAYAAGMILTILSATPILSVSVIRALHHTGLRNGECMAVGIAISLLAVAGISLLRIKHRAEVWIVQKDLRTGNEKTRGVRHIIRRILYALVYFAALCALVFLGCSTLVPVWGSFILGVLRLLWKPILLIASILFIWLFVIRSIRHIADRRKFLQRLQRMSGRGELSYQIHGHPYLSVLFSWVNFSLTITDAPHPSGRRKKDATYQVAVANCKYRRGMVILCDKNIYRFVVFALNFRTLAQHNWGGLSVASTQIVTMPIGAIYTNHTFAFPEGEGERILLVDPAPRVLCMYGQREGEMIGLDNASKVFGYTVYGKNSFVNMLERT